MINIRWGCGITLAPSLTIHRPFQKITWSCIYSGYHGYTVQYHLPKIAAVNEYISNYTVQHRLSNIAAVNVYISGHTVQHRLPKIAAVNV